MASTEDQNAGSVSAHRFARVARLIFAIALASFVLSFVHRTAPAAIAGELTQADIADAPRIRSPPSAGTALDRAGGSSGRQRVVG